MEPSYFALIGAGAFAIAHNALHRHKLPRFQRAVQAILVLGTFGFAAAGMLSFDRQVLRVIGSTMLACVALIMAWLALRGARSEARTDSQRSA